MRPDGLVNFSGSYEDYLRNQEDGLKKAG